jgi:hypothetical protein
MSTWMFASVLSSSHSTGPGASATAARARWRKFSAFAKKSGES